MALLGGKRIHLAITDSRGSGLKEKVRSSSALKELFETKICKGATLATMVEEAENHLKRCPFDVVYIVGGACDITSKDLRTNLISYDWKNGKDLREHLVGMLKKADARLKKYFPASKVVFCSLIGSELARTVNAHATSEEQQVQVNKAVWEFNTNVFRINKERESFSPSLHNHVHRICKGKEKNYYQHLRDGLHLSDELKDKWAEQFLKAIAKN